MSTNYEPSTLSSSFSPTLLKNTLKKKAQSKRHNTKTKNNNKFQIPPLTPPSKLLKRSSCSLIKKEIGFYTITDHPLGTSNGNVFLGFNTLQYTKVAVKIIKLLVHINDIHHIENEVKLLDKMKYSKRVVKLLNYFVDEWSNGYLIFELADMNLMEYYWKEAGCVGDRDDYLKKDGMVAGFLTKEENVVLVFRQVVKAVGDLHANKIAHRDLKMENLFVFLKDGEKGGIRVKVGDLGLSTECERDEKLTMFCGSPLYSAPEVNQGIPYCGYKYDVWSLGIIFYFLLFGNFPFNVYKHEVAKESEDEDDIRRNIITNLFKKIQSEPLAFDGKKSISESNKMLLKLLLCKEPEERPYIEDVLQHPALQK